MLSFSALGVVPVVLGVILASWGHLRSREARRRAKLLPVEAWIEGEAVLERFTAPRGGHAIDQIGPRYTLAFEHQGKIYRSTRREGYLQREAVERAMEKLPQKRVLYINPSDPRDALEVRANAGVPVVLTLSGVGLILLGVSLLCALWFS